MEAGKLGVRNSCIQEFAFYNKEIKQIPVLKAHKNGFALHHSKINFDIDNEGENSVKPVSQKLYN